MNLPMKPAPVLVVTLAPPQPATPFATLASRVVATELRIVQVCDLNESRAAAVSPLHNP